MKISVSHDLSDRVITVDPCAIWWKKRNKISIDELSFKALDLHSTSESQEVSSCCNNIESIQFQRASRARGEPTFERRQYSSVLIRISPYVAAREAILEQRFLTAKNYLWRQFLGGYYIKILWFVRDLKLLQWSGHKVNLLNYLSVDSRIVFMNIWNVWGRPSASLSWLELNNHFPADVGPNFPCCSDF